MFSSKTTLTLTLAAAVVAMANAANAAHILPLEDFETPGDFGVWTPNATAIYYNFDETDQPAGALTVNFSAPGGEGAVDLRKSGGTITSPVLTLDSFQSPDLTISAYVSVHNGTTTRRTNWEISFDGGSNWILLGVTQIGGGSELVNNEPAKLASITLTEGVAGGVKNVNLIGSNAYAGQAFTDNTLIRFNNVGSAGADYRQFYDNIEVTSTVVVPEPASLATALFGLTLIAVRRRRK